LLGHFCDGFGFWARWTRIGRHRSRAIFTHIAKSRSKNGKDTGPALHTLWLSGLAKEINKENPLLYQEAKAVCQRAVVWLVGVIL
jgi:hypothetical protein